MPDTYFTYGTDMGGLFDVTPYTVAIAIGALLAPIWLGFGAFLALREAPVDKPNRVAQLYGYTVCLITLLLTLVSVSSILDSAFERANPLQGGDFPFGTSLTSFEAYKAKRGAASPFERPASAPPDTASDATLQTRYDALVAERLATVRYRTTKDLVTKGLLLIIGLALFAFHWRWVRRVNGQPPSAAV